MTALIKRFSRLFAEAVFVLCCIAFSWYFAHIRLSRPEWEPVTFDKLVAGTGGLPMQYRTLIPWLSRVLMELPLPCVENVRGLRLGFEAASLFALALVYRIYLGGILTGTHQAMLCSLLLFLVLPYNLAIPTFAPWYYVYDVPSILFFTGGLLFLHRKWWLSYYLLFPIATLNRETTCFLTLVYLCSSVGRETLPRILVHCLAQCIIWLTIKAALMWIYGTVHGSIYFNMFSCNVHSLASISAWSILLSSFGYVWVPMLIFWRWIDDPFARRACLVLPFFMIAMVNAGVIQEIRIYGELIPVVLTSYICILRHAFLGDAHQLSRRANQASDAPSEPAPSAASPAHQG